MGLEDDLSLGIQTAKAVTGIVEGVGTTLQQLGVISLNEEQKAKVQAIVNDGVLRHNDQLIGAFKAEIEDMKSARDMQTNILKDAPHWVKALSAVVIPYGGIMALTVFFFNIMVPWITSVIHLLPWVSVPADFNIPRIVLTDRESYTIDGIIFFFFGYRLTQKLTGIAGKY